MSTFLITGASRGLGAALSAAAAEAGHQVVMTSRNIIEIKPLIDKYPETVCAFPLDITDKIAIDAAVAFALERFGQIDVLVNNAGYGLVGALEEYSEEQMRRVFEVNFWGSVNLIRAVLPSMRARKSGRIMNISAIAGFSNEVGFSIYGGAKFALEGLSESLSSDLRHLGIKVIIVEPGPFRTDFISRSMERSTNVMDDYRQSTGKFAAYLEKFAGSQPGDPALAATAMLDTCLNERPPQRLVLGKFAHKKVRDKLKRVEDELNQWQAVSEPTDFV